MCTAFLITTIILIIYYEANDLGFQMLQTEFWACGIAVVFIGALLVGFATSYMQIRKTIAETNIAMKLNPMMLVLNISLFTFILLSQIFYWCTFGDTNMEFFVSFIASTFSRLVLKIVFLYLVEAFGRELTVKSTVLATGTVLIIGCDVDGKELFSYGVDTVNGSFLDDVS